MTTEQTYELVGLTREQAMRCGELLAGGAIFLSRGRAWITEEVQIQPASETKPDCTTFEVRNGPTSLPCDHCRKSVSDHLCPTTMRAPLAPERQPDGYAYRYRHWDGGYVLRFNGGEEVNLSKPIEAVPYWLGHAEPRIDAAGFPEKTSASQCNGKCIGHSSEASTSEWLPDLDCPVHGRAADVSGDA